MSERPGQRPRERRPSWSQLQVVRKPNKPRDDSPCSRKRTVAAHPGERRTTDHRTRGGEIGGIEGSIIRFFGKGVVRRSSKKRASPEKQKRKKMMKKKKEKDRGGDGRHGDYPRPAESGPRVVESASPETAASTTDAPGAEAEAEASKTDVPGTETTKTRAADADASTAESARAGAAKAEEALNTATAGTQTEKAAAPTGERPGTPVPDTDAPNPATTGSPARPKKKAPRAPARPGPRQRIAQRQDETGPAATPPAGASPACACARASAKSEEEEEGKGAPKAGGRAGEQPEGKPAAAPVDEAPPGGGGPGEDEKGGTAAELRYCQEPGPAGRVDSSWLGTFRDRLMGY
ncbi:hypothetical protein LY76DRAFT_646102 [Colletotrichum caudatum]|nr:hypothetical protein LY76DRAFT_646102 [Colletotrichum caudatum]